MLHAGQAEMANVLILFLFNFGNTFAFDLFNQKLQCINNMWSYVAAYQYIHYVVAKFKLAFIKPNPDIPHGYSHQSTSETFLPMFENEDSFSIISIILLVNSRA
ncbi:MAG: hypothetical protein JL57_17845 [Desulfosporosinus sp. BICA1-9]|nr:MAG: hypothetical protein JL57_17845 [Desulfosporosinus sp. BICA1-9]